MAKKQTEEKWLEGRDRPVRVYLTEEEHALARLAAAKTDRSVSRFSVESIVEKARKVLGMSVDAGSSPATQEQGAGEDNLEVAEKTTAEGAAEKRNDTRKKTDRKG